MKPPHHRSGPSRPGSSGRDPSRPFAGRPQDGRGGKDRTGGKDGGRDVQQHDARRADAKRPDNKFGKRPDGSRPDAGRPDRPRPDRPRPEGGERRPLSLPAAQERHAPRAPGGAIWLYGIHAVAAALANPARLLRRLMLTEEAEPEVLARVPRGLPLTPERTDRARLDQLLGRGIVHQGAALLADPLPQLSLQQALERPGPVLVLDQVTDPRNVGAIIRSAAAFGAACVIVQDRNAPEETGAMAKSASGALERLPLIRAVNIARTLIALRAAGLWIVGLDGAGPPLNGAALAQRRVALVLGSEGEGMRRLTRETCDEVAGIRLPGRTVALDSLNVSAAASVALYELTRAP